MCIVAMVGCGASTPPARVEPAAEPIATSSEAPALVLGPASWLIAQELRIDERGNVFVGSERIGTLTANGEMLGRHGEVDARLAPDGTVEIRGEASPFRIVGNGIVETSSSSGNDGEAFARIEGTDMLVGSGSELERLAITGFRPELTREVLFVSVVMLTGLAHAYGGP
jgi:hypothetical protein